MPACASSHRHRGATRPARDRLLRRRAAKPPGRHAAENRRGRRLVRIGVIGATGLVGSQLVSQALARGHETVRVSRSLGHDLQQHVHPGEQALPHPDALVEILTGCVAVINVLQCQDLDERAATAFFEATTIRLASACATAGVRRTVLLSIIGVDEAATSPDADPGPATTEGYYRAKYAQEQLHPTPGNRGPRAAIGTVPQLRGTGPGTSGRVSSGARERHAGPAGRARGSR